jgi:hypothetical protein
MPSVADGSSSPAARCHTPGRPCAATVVVQDSEGFEAFKRPNGLMHKTVRLSREVTKYNFCLKTQASDATVQC